MTTAFSDHSSMLSCLSNICSLEPEDLILNDLFQDKPENPAICRNCDEKAKATSKCKHCDELLCDMCVRAHIRVKLTKDHLIVPLEDAHLSPPFSGLAPGANQSKANNPSLNSNPWCEAHLNEKAKLYCETCYASVCSECILTKHRGHSFTYLQDALEGARSVANRLLSEAKLGAHSAKEGIDLSHRMIENLSLNAHMILRDIRSIMRKFEQVLEEREKELVVKVQKSRAIKQKALQLQVDNLKSIHSNYSRITDMIATVLDVGTSADILQAKGNAYAELSRLRSIRGSMPLLDDEIVFNPPDPSFLMAVTTMGDVVTPGLSCNGSIGDGILRNISVPSPPFHHLNNCLDDLTSVGEAIPPFIPSLVDSPLQPLCEDDSKILWPPTPFRPKLDVLPQMNARGSRVPGPLPLNMSASSNSLQRNYAETGRPKMIVGCEGEKDGQLCRPWGVCCDLEGNIIVADRSNNRIQIFKSDGTFLRKFGSLGPEPGHFDRPAGVAVDPLGRIVVTDKDNHRIQVFTSDGQFVFTFGEKGSKVGQFNYPWDVAVDSKGKIVVSDTRNHRIQLFTMDGTYLCKYGFENIANMVKHFDSPRGVCFGSKGCVIVTDFNNHRLVVIDPNFRNARFLGSEGSAVKQFLRPQGVAVDPGGNIIVADSRNNRIQVFEPNGSFLRQFGTAGKDPGQLDRPSGVCLTPDGKIVVVDFGNNRIQMF